jgi:glycosyltransferase involved in cell wall biosynthesis
MVALFKEAGAVVDIKNIAFDIDPIYIYRLSNFLRENHIDVIHAHELKAVTNGLLAGFFSETRVRISHTHTPISEWTIEKYKKAYDFLKVFGYAQLVRFFGSAEIALTQSRKDVKEREGIPANKLFIIPNAIEPSQFDIPDSKKQAYRNEILTKYSLPTDAYVFGYVSRITMEKGHDLLVDAFANLLKMQFVDKDKVYLLLAGGGSEESKLRNKIKELGIEDRVVITGVFATEDLIKYYSTLDIFVFPSKTEGFGIVLIEAMACGLPCICTDLPVLQEVGGSLCMYFELGNMLSLSQRMLDLYSRRNNLSNLKLGGIERVKELYSMDKFIISYEKLYMSLMEKHS